MGSRPGREVFWRCVPPDFAWSNLFRYSPRGDVFSLHEKDNGDNTEDWLVVQSSVIELSMIQDSNSLIAVRYDNCRRGTLSRGSRREDAVGASLRLHTSMGSTSIISRIPRTIVHDLVGPTRSLSCH